MAVSVIMPTKKQDDDPLDKIAKALNIAQSIYGMRVDSKKIDALKVEGQRQAEEYQTKKDELVRKRGIESPGEDPNSDLSKTVRATYESQGIKVPGTVSAAQAKPYFGEANVKHVDPATREAAAWRLQDAKDKAEDRKVAKENQAKSAQKNQREFEKRKAAIDNRLDAIAKMIGEKGTYEMLGSHNKDLDSALTSVAIDSAKLFDPESVARESEVAAFKSMMFEPGVSTANKTALDVVSNFKKMIQERADLARDVDRQSPEQFSAAQPAEAKSSGSINSVNVSLDDIDRELKKRAIKKDGISASIKGK